MNKTNMSIGYGFVVVFSEAPCGNIAATITRNGRNIVSRFAPTKRGAIESVIICAPFLRESQIVLLENQRD